MRLPENEVWGGAYGSAPHEDGCQARSADCLGAIAGRGVLRGYGCGGIARIVVSHLPVLASCSTVEVAGRLSNESAKRLTL